MRNAASFLLFGVLSIFILAAQADGQTLNFPKLPDRPAQFEILNEPDSPLRISHAYLDEFPNGRKVLKYSVVNVGAKSIRSASIAVHYGEGNIHGQTGFFTSMVPGMAHDGVVYLDELIAPDLRGGQIITDYVFYTDGTTWGKNDSGEADVNLGHETGQLDATRASRTAIDDRQALAKLLQREDTGRAIASFCTPAKPKLCEGYRFGYALTVATLRTALQYRKIDGFLEKLSEIERSFETNLISSSRP